MYEFIINKYIKGRTCSVEKKLKTVQIVREIGSFLRIVAYSLDAPFDNADVIKVGQTVPCSGRIHVESAVVNSRVALTI